MGHKKNLNAIRVATDGACKPNPGREGWAFIANVPGQEELIKVSGSEEYTTNNRMELTAVLKCLEYFKDKKEILIVSDSQYVINCIVVWLDIWKRNNWTKGDGNPVINDDLLKQIDSLLSFHSVRMFWVRGHSGHLENEKANDLAQKELLHPSILT